MEGREGRWSGGREEGWRMKGKQGKWKGRGKKGVDTDYSHFAGLQPVSTTALLLRPLGQLPRLDSPAVNASLSSGPFIFGCSKLP